jgi:hypothetical protein
VLAGVPVEERCHCREAKEEPNSPDKAAPSIMRRIFGG